MDKSCKKCNKAIALNELPITCGGFCADSHRYHAKCLGLTYVEHNACYHNNIFWICDQCREISLNPLLRNIVNGLVTAERKTDLEIDSLRTEVAKLNETVHHLMESQRNAISTSSQQESPIAADGLLSSTKISADGSASVSRNDSHSSTGSSTDKGGSLEIHLSNIANDVTEHEVAEMVADVLKTRSVPSVKMLVPAWRDTTSMEFISFKVEIDASLRSTALMKTSWPLGVRCREFVNFGRNVWRPMSRSV